MPSKCIAFVAVDEPPFGLDTDNLTVQKDSEDDDLVFGTYDYESDAMFGSPTTATDDVIYDTETGLFGFTNEGDAPKPYTVVQALQDGGVAAAAPEYPASASHDFFETYGFNGYCVSFRDDLRTYRADASARFTDVEEVAEERAMYGDEQMGENLVEAVTNEFINDSYYVASMDMKLEQDGENIRFSNPMRFVGIDLDNWDRQTKRLIVKRARELYQDDVKTVDEVLAE